MIIFSFEAEYLNSKTGEKKWIVFDSTKNFIEAWREAASFFTAELLKMDKSWICTIIRYKA